MSHSPSLAAGDVLGAAASGLNAGSEARRERGDGEVTNVPFPQEQPQSLRAKLLFPEKEEKEKSDASKITASFAGI